MSSFRVEGVVYKIYPKKFGNKPERYTIKIDGDKTWYRADTDRYAGIAEPGNKITFEAESLPDGESAKVVRGTVKLAAQTAPAVANAPYAALGSDRQNSIVYQSSLKAALEMVDILVRSEALKLPAKQAARAAAVEAAVDRYTAQFFNDVNTLGAVVREAEGDSDGEGAEEESSEEDDDE